MKIRELQSGEEDRVKELAYLHRKSFPDFFLTQLGVPFLNTLYKGYLEDDDSGIIVAENEEKIIGFIAYSKDYSRFYKGLIKNRIIQFAWCSFLAAIQHPSFVKRLFRAFKKSDSVKKKDKYVEVASICTDPAYEGRGVGSSLIEYMKSLVDFSIYKYINLETDAENNEKAIRFYLKNGFLKEREYVTAEGRKMIEFRYR